MTSVTLLLLFRLFLPCLFSRSTFPHVFPFGHSLFGSPSSHARASPDSHLLSLFPRSALRMSFLDVFSSSLVVIPVDSFFPQSFYTALFLSLLSRTTIQQSSSVTLGSHDTTQLVDMSSHWLLNSRNDSSYKTHMKARYAHPRDDTEALGIKVSKTMRIVHSAK
jgi:hypothetical protein